MLNAQIILDKINRSIVDAKDINRVTSVLQTGFLSKPEGGSMVVELQKQMAEMHNKTYAFGVNSGTSSLHCAISAIELTKGDEVIVPVLANIADCSSVIQEGGKPVFVDIEADTFNIDPNKIEAKITKRTKAIIIVHMYGMYINNQRNI